MTDELELLGPPGEGMTNEDGEVGVLATLESIPALLGTELADATGMRHFAAYAIQEGNIVASSSSTGYSKGVLRRTMTLPNDPVPSTSRISYCFFFEKLGG